MISRIRFGVNRVKFKVRVSRSRDSMVMVSWVRLTV